MRTAVATALFVAVFAACVPTSSLTLPERGEAQSAIFLLQDEGAEPVAVVRDLNASTELPITASAGTRIVVLYYRSSLTDRWSIPPGTYRPEIATPRTPLPPPDVAWQAVLPEEGTAIFTDVTATAPFELPFTGMFIKDISVASCAEAKGCIGAYRRCDLECRIDPPLANVLAPNLDVDPECPALWRTRDTFGPLHCEPEIPTCTNGQVYTPGRPCRTILPDCTSDQVWPAIIPPNAVRVLSADITGDQTMPSPETSIEDALGRGGPIILSKGRHTPPLVIDRPAELIGACAQTLITAPLTVSRTSVSVRDLTLAGPARGLVATDNATVTAERVYVEPAAGQAIFIHHSRGVLRDLRVRAARGVLFFHGSSGSVEDAELEVAGDAVSLESSTATVARMHFIATSSLASALSVVQSSVLTASEIVADGPLRHVITSIAARASLAHVFARHMAVGGTVTLGGTLELIDATLLDVGQRGLGIDAGGRAIARGMIVSSSGLPGQNAVILNAGSTLDAERLVVSGSQYTALNVLESSSVTIRDSIFDRNGEISIAAALAATLRLERTRITNTASKAMVLADVDFTGTDVFISGALRGIDSNKSAIDVDGLYVEGVRERAVDVGEVSDPHFRRVELSGEGSAGAIGIYMKQTPISVDGCYVHDFDVGMSVPSGNPTMSNSVFARNRFGLQGALTDDMIREAFTRVGFYDNTLAIDEQ